MLPFVMKRSIYISLAKYNLFCYIGYKGTLEDKQVGYNTMKKYLITTITILFVCSCMLYGCSEDDAILDDAIATDSPEIIEPDIQEEPVQDEEITETKETPLSFTVYAPGNAVLDSDFNISSYYCTTYTSIVNKFWIDEDGVLWGNGQNTYGQLGNGSADMPHIIEHEEPVRIAENVVSVAASCNGYFMIYLTDNGELYGVGSNRLGLLGLPFDETSWSDESYTIVTKPVLLMEDVSYAFAGVASIVALKDDGSVWFWGEYKTTSLSHSYPNLMQDYWAPYEDDTNPAKILYNHPTKILDNCIYATTGNCHGAAITQDGDLYTWGLNIYGDCGVPVTDDDFVRIPTKVLEDVNMVWVETIDSRGISNTYTIKPDYVNFNNNNLFAITNDGTIMMTGKDVGTAEKEVEVSGDLDIKSTSRYVDVFTPVILH